MHSTAITDIYRSSYYPQYFGPQTTLVNRTTQVLRSFYNYILLHDVCPEHADDIRAARNVCDLADKELPEIFAVGELLPGTFNKAASALFGGSWAEIYPPDRKPDSSWDDVDYNASWTGESPSVMAEKSQTFRPEAMKAIFKTGVTARGSESAFKHLEKAGVDAFYVVRTDANVGLTVLATEPASAETRALYAEQNKRWGHKLHMQSLGTLRCEKWALPDMDAWDLPAAAIADMQRSKRDLPERLEFWLEDDILPKCVVGMKIRATLKWLACGIPVLDEVQQVHASFYESLPNELMMQARVKEVKILKHRERKAREEKMAEEEAERAAKEAELDGVDAKDEEAEGPARIEDGEVVEPEDRVKEDGFKPFVQEA